MANGMERSIDPLVIANLEDTIPLESIKVGNEVTEESPVKTVESVSDVPEKKSWWSRFSKKGDKKKAEENYPPVNPVKIFRYATILELLLMGVGLIAGIFQGGAFPLVFLAIGEVLNAFFKFEAVATACSTNYFMNTTSSTCSISSSLNTNSSFLTYVNGSFSPDTSWFFCAANSEGIALNIPSLSSLTAPVIDTYCYTSQYYNRLTFTDNSGCCSTFESCTREARANLYTDVLLCNVLMLAGLGLIVAISSYIQVMLPCVI